MYKNGSLGLGLVFVLSHGGIAVLPALVLSLCAQPTHPRRSFPPSTMSLQHFGRATLRVAKNYTKGYSDVQAKVRDATSNDPWGPTGTQMNELAQMTYNQYA